MVSQVGLEPTLKTTQLRRLLLFPSELLGQVGCQDRTRTYTYLSQSQMCYHYTTWQYLVLGNRIELLSTGLWDLWDSLPPTQYFSLSLVSCSRITYPSNHEQVITPRGETEINCHLVSLSHLYRINRKGVGCNGRTRTCNILINNQAFYLWTTKQFGVPSWNRTTAQGFSVQCSSNWAKGTIYIIGNKPFSFIECFTT